MKFINLKHERCFYELLYEMKSTDPYHASYAYLLALIEAPVNDCFDFEQDKIKPDVVDKDWVSGTDYRILKLALNLWNPFHSADISEVFGYIDSEIAPYVFEAIRIRFEHISLWGEEKS